MEIVNYEGSLADALDRYDPFQNVISCSRKTGAQQFNPSEDIMDSWSISIAPCDGLNPGFGYTIHVERNGETMLRTDRHPISGEPLNYFGALEVAAMYGPPKDEA